MDGINLHLFTTKPEEVYAAFAEVAGQTRLPLLGYDENYPADLVARLSTIPGVCGLKSHDALYRYHDFIRAVEGKKFVIVGGGQMRNFLYGYLIGSQGYLCAYAPFAPAIAFRFYGALERNDLDEARRVMFDYEDPLMKVAGGLGWGQSIKSILQIKGLFQTNLWRPPVPSHGPEPKKATAAVPGRQGPPVALGLNCVRPAIEFMIEAQAAQPANSRKRRRQS